MVLVRNITVNKRCGLVVTGEGRGAGERSEAVWRFTVNTWSDGQFS